MNTTVADASTHAQIGLYTDKGIYVTTCFVQRSNIPEFYAYYKALCYRPIELAPLREPTIVPTILCGYWHTRPL